MTFPLIVLAPPRSYSSLIAQMLGQHPQMYGLPELHLFTGDTVGELLTYFESEGQRAERRADGLRRAIAELFMGSQTQRTVALAANWLRKNREESTVAVLDRILKRASAEVVVEKSITSVWNTENLERAIHCHPEARFLHLTRHPRTHGESILDLIKTRNWHVARGIYDYSTTPPTVDPQLLWLRLHASILEGLADVPEERQRQVSAERVLTDSDRELAAIADWLGLRADAECIEQMRHPERSPFAGVGPDNAPTGSDAKFLESPKLDTSRVKNATLDGPLPWRDDIPGFISEVQHLATRFGYS